MRPWLSFSCPIQGEARCSGGQSAERATLASPRSARSENPSRRLRVAAQPLLGLTRNRPGSSPARKAPVAGVSLAADTGSVQTVLGILATVTFAVGLPALWIGARRKRNAPQGQPSRITSAMVRYVGLLPADPTELQRLLWARRFNLRVSGPWIPVLILVALYIGATWAYVALAVILLAEVCSLALLTRDIRRARQDELAG